MLSWLGKIILDCCYIATKFLFHHFHLLFKLFITDSDLRTAWKEHISVYDEVRLWLVDTPCLFRIWTLLIWSYKLISLRVNLGSIERSWYVIVFVFWFFDLYWITCFAIIFQPSDLFGLPKLEACNFFYCAKLFRLEVLHFSFKFADPRFKIRFRCD